MTEKDVLQLISEKMPEMSKGQIKIAEYVKQHLEEAAFETASKIGRTVDVSESTVVRFAMKLGFEGYPEYQKAIAESIKEERDTIRKLDEKYDGAPDSDVYSKVMASDIDNLQKTAKAISPMIFDMAVEQLLSSEKVYIMGHGNNAPLAAFLVNYLSRVRENVFLIDRSSLSESFEAMLHIGEKDCFVGIGFTKYSMITLKCMEFANDRNAKVISLTDDAHSPMNFYSSCNIMAVTEMNSLVESLTAPLSVINSLVVAICLKRPVEIDSNRKMLGRVCETYQAFEEDNNGFVNDTDEE